MTKWLPVYPINERLMNLFHRLPLWVIGLSFSHPVGWAQSTPLATPSATSSPWTLISTRSKPRITSSQTPAAADTIALVWTAGPTRRTTTIQGFLAASPTYTWLLKALGSTDWLSELGQTGIYTLFAPTNSAFLKLAPDLQQSLLTAKNTKALTYLLGCHLLRGGLDTIELRQRIKAGKGNAYLLSVAGDTLTARFGLNWQIVLTDQRGHTAIIDQPDRLQQNGIVHGIDAVLLPATGFFSRR